MKSWIIATCQKTKNKTHAGTDAHQKKKPGSPQAIYHATLLADTGIVIAKSKEYVEMQRRQVKQISAKSRPVQTNETIKGATLYRLPLVLLAMFGAYRMLPDLDEVPAPNFFSIA